MGIQVDHNKPYSPEVKEYLRERGRAYMIPANERRFGVNGDKEPEPHEQADNHAISPFYQSEKREAAIYDVGGAPLPGTTLDYNTGRVADRENGVLAEYTGPGHTPGAHNLSAQRDSEFFDSYDVDENGNPVDDHVDEDIVKHALAVPNKAELVRQIKKLQSEGVTEVEYSGSDDREALETKLAIALQDKRDAGGEVKLEIPPEDREAGAAAELEAQVGS